MISIAIIDQQMSEHGRFCLIDWLLAENMIAYLDYEAWRYAKVEYISEKISCENKQLKKLYADCELFCKELGLVTEEQHYLCWDNNVSGELKASSNTQLHKTLTQRWKRPQDIPQLDLFMDNSAQQTEHLLMQQLSGRQFVKAQQLLDKLTELNAQSKRLGGYQDLINYGEYIQVTTKIDQSQIEEEFNGLKNEVASLAHSLLGSDARDYLSLAWRRLADNLVSYPFNPKKDFLHVSEALMEIPDYFAAINFLRKEKKLFSQPYLLNQLALCYEKQHQIELSFLVWCCLMELDSEYTEKQLDEYTCSQINSYWQDFWEFAEVSEENITNKEFPAYLLIRVPALFHQLSEFPAFKETVTIVVIELLQVKINKKNEMEERSKLQKINPSLLKFYLARNTY